MKKHWDTISLIIAAVICLYHYFVEITEFPYSAANSMSLVIVLVFVFGLIGIVINKIRKRWYRFLGHWCIDGLNGYSHVIFSILLVSVLLNAFLSPHFCQFNSIHHLQTEPSGGTYAYYVEAQRGYGDTTYTLPAEVIISYSENINESYNSTTLEYEEHLEVSDCFIVQKVYFDNGGYLYFEEQLEFSKPNKKTSGYDQDGVFWHITLTDNYTKSQYITEYNPLDKISYIQKTLEVVLPLIYLFILISKAKKYDVMRDFISHVHCLIRDKGTTEKEMLADLGLDPHSFIIWELSGKVPNNDTLQKIADYFEVSVCELTHPIPRS